jgi:nitrogen regulatory protein P-II 1
MKEIKAIIQPFLLSKVVDALKEIEDLPGITVSEVRGFGKGRARNAAYKVVEDGIDYATKMKLEIVIPDRMVEEVLRIVSLHGRTGNPGDGKIFVSSIDEVVNIRTGNRGEMAI